MGGRLLWDCDPDLTLIVPAYLSVTLGKEE
jgi:hypothetical protein